MLTDINAFTRQGKPLEICLGDLSGCFQKDGYLSAREGSMVIWGTYKYYSYIPANLSTQ